MVMMIIMMMTMINMGQEEEDNNKNHCHHYHQNTNNDNSDRRSLFHTLFPSLLFAYSLRPELLRHVHSRGNTAVRDSRTTLFYKCRAKGRFAISCDRVVIESVFHLPT